MSTQVGKYYKAKFTSKKVIQIAITEANVTAAEANEVIRVLADDKQTPPPSQSSTERYAAKLFLISKKHVGVMFCRLKYLVKS